MDRPEALPRSVRITLRADVRIKQTSADAKAKLELTEAEVALKSAVDEARLAKQRTEAGVSSTGELRKAEGTLQVAEARYSYTKEQAKTGPPGSTVSTQSIGLEGSQVRLDILAGKAEGGDLALCTTLTPVITMEQTAEGEPEEQTISLTGHGVVSGRAPFPFSTEFDAAVSLRQGEGKSVASGSAQTADGEVAFDVFVRASIEERRVKLPAGGQMSSGGGFGGVGGGQAGGGRRSW